MAEPYLPRLVRIVFTHGFLSLGHAASTPPASAAPSRADEIFKLTRSQFAEPFIATAPTSPSEDEALRQAVMRYRDRQAEDDFSALTGYLADFPRSGWRVAVLTNLGLSYYHDGFF